jgi:hypothetical protein
MQGNASKLFLLFKDAGRFISVHRPISWLIRTYNKRGRSIEINITSEVSVTWKKAYEKYAKERKQLSRY